MYSAQHENMFIKIASSIIAFILGSAAAVKHPSTNLSIDLSATLLSPETLEFILRSAIGGVIGLGIKVGGDIIVHRWKSKKEKKEGNHE